MKLGFIGFGNMGSAMIKGIISSGIYQPSDIITADVTDASLEKAAALGIAAAKDNSAAAKADIVFLTIKPQFYAEVIDGIKDTVSENTIVVTVAPGWTIERITAAFGKKIKLVRSMPNTPAMVLEGMSELCPNENISDEELDMIKSIYSSFGKVLVLPERLMNAAATAAGCSPAYVYMFIEALADGAVREGLPRKQAYELIAQSVLGSAKMVLETGMHPGELKDQVCSPAGTTIEGVYALEKAGFRAALMDAVAAPSEKSRKM